MGVALGPDHGDVRENAMSERSHDWYDEDSPSGRVLAADLDTADPGMIEVFVTDGIDQAIVRLPVTEFLGWVEGVRRMIEEEEI